MPKLPFVGTVHCPMTKGSKQ